MEVEMSVWHTQALSGKPWGDDFIFLSNLGHLGGNEKHWLQTAEPLMPVLLGWVLSPPS